uniref:Uncharacterized protein n=1 Tax=uncultured marine microorganism HF4000_APKG2H5 TaxID=455545 RepID=B3T6G1_9ZZZZ|nr:hypothetical protein ALOHA_HF4000APKG2H5ctg1g16 [uncultured marine microorganism HF4000_APKG2H5]
MDTEVMVKIILSLTALMMIWALLRHRQKARLSQITDSDEHRGMARNPEALMTTEDSAMREIDKLLSLQNADRDD